MYHHRIQYKHRSFFFIIEDRVWIRLDGTKIWCDKEKAELSKICAKKYNKPLEYFEPIKKSYSEIKEESEKREQKKKKTVVKSLFKSWKIKLK